MSFQKSLPKDAKRFFFEQSYPMLLNVELVGPTEQKLNDIEAPGGAKKKKKMSARKQNQCVQQII